MRIYKKDRNESIKRRNTVKNIILLGRKLMVKLIIEIVQRRKEKRSQINT